MKKLIVSALCIATLGAALSMPIEAGTIETGPDAPPPSAEPSPTPADGSATTNGTIETGPLLDALLNGFLSVLP